MRDREKQKAAQAAYEQRNADSRKTTTIRFNLKESSDVELYEHLMSKGNSSGYIKELIRKDMEG